VGMDAIVKILPLEQTTWYTSVGQGRMLAMDQILQILRHAASIVEIVRRGSGSGTHAVVTFGWGNFG
jgi:hypothetical protein